MASARETERALGAELLEALRHQAQTQTEFLERLAGQTVNHCLEVYSGTFDATGQFTREYQVAAGCVKVRNLGVAANIITVSSAGPGTGAPSGTGTFLIPGGETDVVPLASRTFTLYGAAGDRFAIAVFTTAAQPVAS